MAYTKIFNPFTGTFDYVGVDISSITAGSILFSNGADISSDPVNLFWDDTNKRQGIGTNTPDAYLHTQKTTIIYPPNPNSVQELYDGNFYNWFIGDYAQYTYYSFKVIGGITYYSAPSSPNDITISTDGDYVYLNWEPGSGVDGYILVRSYSGLLGTFDGYEVVLATTYTDYNDNFSNGTFVGTPASPINQYAKLLYNDGVNDYGFYTNLYSYFGASVGINKTPTVALDVFGRTILDNGGDSTTTLKVYGSGDGGYITREQIAWYNKNTGNKMGSFSDDGSGTYGLFSIGGSSASSGRMMEMDSFDRALGGDQRTGSIINEQDQSGLGGYAFNITTRNSGGGFNYSLYCSANGNIGVAGILVPTAKIHLQAGSTSAKTAPLKFSSGNLMTSPEAGAVEYLTDKWYGTISTGTARKEFTLNDIALTSGRIPFATTNGRLTDDSDFTFATDTLTVTKIAATQITGNMTIADAINVILNSTTGTKIGTATTQKLAFFNSTPIVQPSNTTDLRQALINLGLYATGGATPLDLNGGNFKAAGITLGVVSKTGAYTLTDSDYTVLADLTSTAFTLTLPTAVGRTGKEFVLKDWKGQSATRNLTIATTSSQTIDGAASKTISTNYNSIKVISDGANWAVI